MGNNNSNWKLETIDDCVGVRVINSNTKQSFYFENDKHNNFNLIYKDDTLNLKIEIFKLCFSPIDSEKVIYNILINLKKGESIDILAGNYN